jgi:hypothetical protein
MLLKSEIHAHTLNIPPSRAAVAALSQLLPERRGRPTLEVENPRHSTSHNWPTKEPMITPSEFRSGYCTVYMYSTLKVVPNY